MVKPPNAVVSVVIHDHLGRVLLQQRDEKPNLAYSGFWTLFGGSLEHEETPEVGLYRELDEELALHAEDFIQPPQFWYAYTCAVRDKTNHIFTAHLERNIEKITLFEGQKADWFTPETALNLELAFAQSIVLQQFYAHYWPQFERTATLKGSS